MAEKEEALEVEGVVTQALANMRFRVALEGGHTVIAHVAGRIARISFVLFRATRCAWNFLPTT